MTTDSPPAFTESEAVTLAPLLFGSAVVLIAWIAGAAGVPLHPPAILIVSAAAGGMAWVSLVRGRRKWRASFSTAQLTGCLLIVVGLFVYLCWLAWPSLLPISEGSDLVHHLSLIHFIQRAHALPPRNTLAAYLGEMDGYPPGSHLLAALAGDALGVDALRVVHPILALAVAIKAGLIFNVLVRLLPSGPARVPSGVAGTLLLLVPHHYLLYSFTYLNFYAQVISETFAIAMLWTIVVWDAQPSRRLLAAFAAFGIVVFLCWPVWLPVPALALLCVVWLQRMRPAAARLIDATVALAPIAAIGAVYSMQHAASAGILSSGGLTLIPAVTMFGWGFLMLMVAGVALVIRRGRGAVPLLAFTAVCLAQVIGLYVLQMSRGATNPYLAHKTVHLLVYPMVLFAAVALDGGRQVLASGLSSPGPAWRRRVVWLFPAVVLVWAVRGGLPLRPIASPITEPLFQAGLWAKRHVPAACVDYLVHHWLTVYWLHVDVLGNPRGSDRMRQEPYNYRVMAGRWIEPGSRRFAIVEEYDRLPADVRRNVRVLERFGPAAVVERVDGQGQCTDDTPPIDRIEIR